MEHGPYQRWNNGAFEPENLNGEGLDLHALARQLTQRWKFIAVWATVPALLVYLFANFLMTPNWEAVASIRPANKESQMMAFMGLTDASVVGSLGGAASMLGMSVESDVAEEDTAILQSYDFNMNVARRHQFGPYLLDQVPAWYTPQRWVRWLDDVKSWFGLKHRAQNDDWRLYLDLQGRFDVEYNNETGDLDLRFVDQDPKMSRSILDWYISDLRAMLRAQEVHSTKGALDSLRAEARATSDAYLQGQLYQMSAVQLQNLKMAEAESDFAFKMIQSPVVPDKPYSPRPALDAAIIWFASLLAALLWVLLGVSKEKMTARELTRPKTEPGVLHERQLVARRPLSSGDDDAFDEPTAVSASRTKR